jgi:hypothetical protein
LTAKRSFSYADRSLLEYGAEAFFAVSQGNFCSFAIGDVAKCYCQAIV